MRAFLAGTNLTAPTAAWQANSGSGPKTNLLQVLTTVQGTTQKPFRRRTELVSYLEYKSQAIDARPSLTGS
jgi:hypothetical protein